MKRQGKKRAEFSKIMLAAVMVVYILTVVFGYFVIANEYTMLGELFAFVGAPTGVAIGFYAWKARAENLVKIRENNKDDKLFDAIRKEDDDGLADNYTADCGRCDTDSSNGIPDYQPETEGKRVVTVRRVRGGKTVRTSDGKVEIETGI